MAWNDRSNQDNSAQFEGKGSLISEDVCTYSFGLILRKMNEITFLNFLIQKKCLE